MRIRPAPIRAAAFVAAGFVAVRVAYRVLFHGADAAGPVVLPLPEVPLPPPFGHVVLFGPATTGGLWDAATSALPIALTILVFGLLNAVLDVPRLLARGARRGPLRGVARTLAVAWAGLPALADAVRRVRFAQRLRGERGGARLLAPVLERTLERATSVAAALELRGLSGRPVEGVCERPVEIHDVALAHRGAATSAVQVDALDLEPGTLTLVTGATGSGKSTLLRALAGLHTHLDDGTAAGELFVVGHERITTPPRDTARLVGVVLQNPREGFATEHVADEIGLALELRGVDATIVQARALEIARRVGIEQLLRRELRGLSAGEATLVAIAAAVAEHPIVLLVDEPLADLDSAYRARIVELLDALAHDAGICVIVAEHRHAEFAAVADARIDLSDGVARHVTTDASTSPDATTAADASTRGPLAHAAAPDPDPDPDREFAPAAAPDPAAGPIRAPGRPGDPVLSVRELTVLHDAHRAVDSASFDLAACEIVALTGPNGAGKSSLLVALATDHHAVTTSRASTTGDTPGGNAVSRRKVVSRRGRERAACRDITLVPDASDDLFTRTTVAAECARTDRRARLAHNSTAARLAEFLGLAPDSAAFEQRLARHPLDLSLGERRCLAIAIQSANEPAVLLVDEPTRGLDPAARSLVAAALSHAAERGAAVLVATHDADFVAALADRVLPMHAGALGEPFVAPAPTVAPPPAGQPSAAPPPAAPPSAAPPPIRTPPPAAAQPTNPTSSAAAAQRPATFAATGRPKQPTGGPSIDMTVPPQREAELSYRNLDPPGLSQAGLEPVGLEPAGLEPAGLEPAGLEQTGLGAQAPPGPPRRAAPSASVRAATAESQPRPARTPRGIRLTTPPRDIRLTTPPRGIRLTTPARGIRPTTPARGIRLRPPTLTAPALLLANLVALASFTWPLVAYALPSQATAAAPAAALALAPVAALVVLAALDGSVRSAHTLALLGTLAAIGAAVRIVGTGVGGVEAVFVLLILAGRAFGARFGLLLGLVTIALSTVVTGTFGPWTPFQMFACAWVGAGAGLLPRNLPRRVEIAMLCVYGVIASYVFGLIMNLWFWPFAIGAGTGISYEAGAPIGQNLASFLLYSLVTSSITWDTLRAITTIIGLVTIGTGVLAAFRRAKPVGPGTSGEAGSPTRDRDAPPSRLVSSSAGR